MTDSTMTEIPLVERLERPLVIEHAVPTPVHEVLQRAADERGEAAAMLKAAVEALEKCKDKFREYERSHDLKAVEAETLSNFEEAGARAFKAKRNQEMADMCDNTLASLKQPGGR